MLWGVLMAAYTADLTSLLALSDDQFYELCRTHPEVKFERTPGGSLLIMPPTGGETGSRNSEVNADLVIWNRQTQLGIVFDSSTCFRLPGGGDRSPDLAWITRARWEALAPEQRKKFPPIAPDFVLELTSLTDRLAEAQAKMTEYMDSGVRLGWLIYRQAKTVWVYRPNQEPQRLAQPKALSEEAVLPGFSLPMAAVW